nr:hypothetical protein [uncultured Cohaesibacter sp.]
MKPLDTSVEEKDMTYDPEIEKLLPWFAKGLLEPDDSEKVETYLAAHPEMHMQLDLIAEETLAVEQQHAALGAPSAGGLDRLLGSIDALEAKSGPAASLAASVAASGRAGRGLSGWIRDFLAGLSTPSMQFVAAAVAVVIVAQAVIIGNLVHGGSQTTDIPSVSTFTTAAGPQAKTLSQAGMPLGSLLVAFRKDASIEAVNGLLKELGAIIKDGPKAGGFYEIVIAQGHLPAGGTQAVLEQLKARNDVVQFASASQ